MNYNEIETYLTENGIRPTANRILVARQLMDATRPLSLADLEIELATMDKSSIFRVLELMAGKELVHIIEDGSRSLKYELCHSNGHHSLHGKSDEHVHFHCEKCGATICLDSIHIPEVELPVGFLVHSANFVLKGICPECDNLKLNHLAE